MSDAMKRGRLFFVVGPSGAGKDTLMAGAIAADPSLIWARRCITRAEAAGGEPFEGLSDAAFDARLQAGAFALHWAAHGLRYGVTHTALAPLAQGYDVLLNGSRGAIDQARAAFPDMAVILITAPDAILAQRLAARGRETADDIAQRLARARFALPSGVVAREVVNDAAPAIGVARLRHAIKG
jgi:ribose 1,5-bisphosphokinase